MNQDTPFTPYRTQEQVWDEFVAWWADRWPGRRLPAMCGLHNLRALTGLPADTLTYFVWKRTPEDLLPPPYFIFASRP